MLFIIIPLSAGLIFYIFNSPGTYISQAFYALIGKEYALFRLNVESSEAAFMQSFFCDICWSWALESSILLILPRKKKSFIASVLISVSVSTVLELLQLLQVVRGTFDIYDIAVETAAIIISGSVVYFISRRKIQ